MQNGQSLLENTVELMADMEEQDRKEFLNFSRKKSRRSEKRYIKLFEKLWKEIQSGNGVDEIEREKLQKWCLEKNISKNFGQLVRELYRLILTFIGEQFKKEEDEKWKIEIENGLYVVQALMKKGFNSQAGMLINKLEEKIPERPDYRPWHEFSMIVKLASLRVRLAERTGFVKATEEDTFLAMLSKNNWPTRHNSDEYKGAENVFNRYSDQIFYLKIYMDSIEKNIFWEKYQKDLGLIINDIPNRTRNLGPYSLKYPVNYFHIPVEQYLENCFWNLHGYGQALENGMYKDALRFLSQLVPHVDREETKNILDLAIVAWMGCLSYETRLIEYWNKSQELEQEEDLEKNIPFSFQIYQYTTELIQYLPHRLEMNRILMLMFLGDFEQASTLIAKMYQIGDLPLYIISRLRILETLTWMQLSRPEVSERTKTTYNYFRKKKEFPFEIAIASILNKCSGWHRSYWKTQIEEKCSMDMKKMKEHLNFTDPLHHFFMAWVQEILAGAYAR